MSSEAWAIVAATALGPVLAVVVSLWREKEKELWSRRLQIFRTLMGTRQIGLSTDHVNALNLVEVDFYGCDRVQQNWKLYKNHLFKKAPFDEEWFEEKEKLLANMLFEMAKTLKFDIPAMEIFKGGYSPSGWTLRDNQLQEAILYINKLSKGTTAIPVKVIHQDLEVKSA